MIEVNAPYRKTPGFSTLEIHLLSTGIFHLSLWKASFKKAVKVQKHVTLIYFLYLLFSWLYIWN